METQENNKPNYSIIKIDDSSARRKTIVRTFYAVDDAAANEELKKFAASNAGTQYYWDHYQTVKIVGDDGNVREYGSFEDTMRCKEKTIVQKMLDLFSSLNQKAIDAWQHAKDICYLLKNKIERRASWSFDTYLLEIIEKTLPKLRDSKIGISPLFLDMAIVELHGKEEGFDLAKYNEKHACSREGYPKDVEDLAEKMKVDTYDEILLHIKLYNYYFSCGECDDAEFDKAWRSTLPIVEGSYDVFDYDKLFELQDKEWSKIWEMMSKFGRSMWD